MPLVVGGSGVVVVVLMMIVVVVRTIVGWEGGRHQRPCCSGIRRRENRN